MTASSQTVSFLKRRFAEVGLTLKSRYGQNFLVDLNLLRLLLRTAEVEPRDVVLEVGSGTGSLSVMLAQQAAAVVSVEIDPRLHQLAYEELIDFDNVTLLCQDALHGKNQLDEVLLSAVAQRLEERPDRRFEVVANLPYCVATPVIANLLQLERPPESMTVTIQLELAERLVARPKTSDYGAVSVWVQSQCDVELVRTLPPDAFWPRPKVTSAIVQIRLDPARRAQIADRAFFHQFARNLFLHRRKLLRGSLLSGFKGLLDKAAVDALLAAQKLPPECRAEELEPRAILALAEAAAPLVSPGARG